MAIRSRALPQPQRHILTHSHSHSTACSTNLEISLSFGGQLWPINALDMNIGTEPNDPTACIAAIFDLDLGTNIEGGNSGNPNWVVGDTFLVRLPSSRYIYYVLILSPRP